MLSQLIIQYGYLIVFIGTLLEGQTILLAAGFAAHQGMLDWKIVWLIATIGATLGDQFFFFTGRWRGPVLIARFPTLKTRITQVQTRMERHHTLFIILLRFLYGLRIAGPIILGAGKLPTARFVILNLIGAILWSSLILWAGYAFGQTLEALLTHIKHIEEIVLAIILSSGFLFWLWRHLCRKSNSHPKN